MLNLSILVSYGSNNQQDGFYGLAGNCDSFCFSETSLLLESLKRYKTRSLTNVY